MMEIISRINKYTIKKGVGKFSTFKFQRPVHYSSFLLFYFLSLLFFVRFLSQDFDVRAAIVTEQLNIYFIWF